MSSLIDEEMENLEDHGCPKIQQLAGSDKKNMGLLQLPILTQDYTSLCGAKSKIVGWTDNAAFEVVIFVLFFVLFVNVSKYLKLLQFFSKIL